MLLVAVVNAATTLLEEQSMTTTNVAPTQEDLDAFLVRFVIDLGSALAGANIVLGDRLGLYHALAARPRAYTSRYRAGHRHRRAVRTRSGGAADRTTDATKLGTSGASASTQGATGSASS